MACLTRQATAAHAALDILAKSNSVAQSSTGTAHGWLVPDRNGPRGEGNLAADLDSQRVLQVLLAHRTAPMMQGLEVGCADLTADLMSANQPIRLSVRASQPTARVRHI
eukprot:131182-Rhodomonas_salina.2